MRTFGTPFICAGHKAFRAATNSSKQGSEIVPGGLRSFCGWFFCFLKIHRKPIFLWKKSRRLFFELYIPKKKNVPPSKIPKKSLPKNKANSLLKTKGNSLHVLLLTFSAIKRVVNWTIHFPPPPPKRDPLLIISQRNPYWKIARDPKI